MTDGDKAVLMSRLMKAAENYSARAEKRRAAEREMASLEAEVERIRSRVAEIGVILRDESGEMNKAWLALKAAAEAYKG